MNKARFVYIFAFILIGEKYKMDQTKKSEYSKSGNLKADPHLETKRSVIFVKQEVGEDVSSSSSDDIPVEVAALPDIFVEGEPGTNHLTLPGSKSNVQTMLRSLSGLKESSRQSNTLKSQNSSKSSLKGGYFYRLYHSITKNEYLVYFLTLLEDLRVLIFIKMLAITLFSGIIIFLAYYMSNAIMSNIAYYNLTHVLLSFFTHLYVAAVWELLELMKIAILAGKLSKKSCTLEEINASRFSDSVVGANTRRLIFALSLLTLGHSIFFSFQLEWSFAVNVPYQGKCTNVKYDTLFTIRDTSYARKYIDGMNGYALASSYGYVLQDGLIGGLASWPIDLSLEYFTIINNGPVYLTTSDCLHSTPSPTLVDSKGTRITLNSYRIVDNEMDGSISVYYPPNTLYEHLDRVNGSITVCQFRLIIGEGTISNNYQVDRYMVAVSSVQAVQVGDQVYDYGNYQSQYAASAVPYLTNDTYGLMPYVTDAIIKLLDGTVIRPSWLSVYINTMCWGTLPDGYYHEKLVSQALNMHLAVISNFFAFQYDPVITSSCTYLYADGSGHLQAQYPAAASAVVGLVIITYFFICMKIWWIALTFSLNTVTSVTAHALMNPLRFAVDMQAKGQDIFNGTVSTYKATNRDILKRVQESEISHGVLRESLSQDDGMRVGFGVKKQIVHIGKLIKGLNQKINENQKNKL